MGLNSNNNLVFEEVSKKIHPIDDASALVYEYLDYFPSSNSKKVKVKNLSEKFSSINAFFCDFLKEYHLPVGFLRTLTASKLEFIPHNRLPFYVKILNNLDKRAAKLFSSKELEPLALPVIEFHYGNGKETLISENYLLAFEMCTVEDLRKIYRICSKVNAVLKSFFERRNASLIEVCCWFGKQDDKIFLVDDFTPQSIKILPAKNDNKMNPYKLATPAVIRHYLDYLYNLTSS